MIAVTADDGVLTSSEADAQVTINLGPPAAGIAGPATSELNQSQSFTLTATDPSPAQQPLGFTFAVNWGDGSPVQQVVGPSGTQVPMRSRAPETARLPSRPRTNSATLARRHWESR